MRVPKAFIFRGGSYRVVINFFTVVNVLILANSNSNVLTSVLGLSYVAFCLLAR